jgi:hypothetical protein
MPPWGNDPAFFQNNAHHESTEFFRGFPQSNTLMKEIEIPTDPKLSFQF